jgi:hypothetical protein
MERLSFSLSLSLSLCGGFAKGTWRDGSFTGDPEGYVKKALETGVFLHRGPVRGPGKGCCFTGDFERRRDFDLSGGLVYRGIREIHLKKALKTANSLHRGPIGGPGGEIRLLGTLGDGKRVLIEWSISLSL